MTGLLDTTTALYLLGGRLAAPLPSGNYGLSVISEMELLSWPSLTAQEEAKVRAFLQTITLCDLTPSIRHQAARLRREERLRLPMPSSAPPRWNIGWNSGPTIIACWPSADCSAGQ